MKINKDDIKEMDFSFLEGREINYFDYGEIRKGIVVGCDYYIGISIMTKDKKLYLACMNGPATWKVKNVTPEANDCSNEDELYKDYDREFYKRVNGILNGYFKVDRPGTGYVPPSSCSFV